MKFLKYRRMLSLVLSMSMIWGTSLSVFAGNDEEGGSGDNPDQAQKAGLSENQYVTNYNAFPENFSDSAEGMHVQQIFLTDQENNAVEIGERNPADSDREELSHLALDGEAAASKRARMLSIEDAKKGIINLQFEMFGKPKAVQEPVNLMVILDQSASMNTAEINTTSLNVMSCLNSKHYYFVPEGELSAEAPCVIDINAYNPTGICFDEWITIKSVNGTKLVYSYDWVKALFDDIREQTTAWQENHTRADLSLEETDEVLENQEVEIPVEEEPAAAHVEEDFSKTEDEIMEADFSEEVKPADGIPEEIHLAEETDPIKTFVLTAAGTAKNYAETAIQDSSSSRAQTIRFREYGNGEIEALVIKPSFKINEDRTYRNEILLDDQYAGIVSRFGNWDPMMKHVVPHEGGYFYFEPDTDRLAKSRQGFEVLGDREREKDPGYSLAEYGCIDRAVLSRRYLEELAEHFLGEKTVKNELGETVEVLPSNNKMAIRMFSGKSEDIFQSPLTNQIEDLRKYFAYTGGGDQTNYQEAFSRADEFLEKEYHEKEIHSPLYTIFITDGLPTAASGIDFTSVPGNFRNVPEYAGYLAAKQYHENNGETFVIALNMPVTDYMASLASHPEKAYAAHTAEEFKAVLSGIETQIVEGYPTECTLYDTLGGGFELLIDSRHPFVVNKDQYMSRENLPREVRITGKPDQKTKDADPSRQSGPGQTVAVSFDRWDQEGAKVSYFVQARPDALRATVKRFDMNTNAGASIRYLSCAAPPGKSRENSATGIFTGSATAEEGARYVVREMKSPVLHVANSLITGRKSVNVHSGTVYPGDKVTYTLTFKNNGTADLDYLSIGDQLDPHLIFPASALARDTETTAAQNQPQYWLLKNFTANSTRSINLEVGIDPDIFGPVNQMNEEGGSIPGLGLNKNSRRIVEIPNQAYFGHEANKMVYRTNEVILHVKEPEERQKPELNDPTAPDRPDQTHDKPVSGSRAPGWTGNPTPSGAADTRMTGSSQMMLPGSNGTSAVIPAAARTAASWFAATPAATSLARHPLLWSAGFLISCIGGVVFLRIRIQKCRMKKSRDDKFRKRRN